MTETSYTRKHRISKTGLNDRIYMIAQQASVLDYHYEDLWGCRQTEAQRGEYVSLRFVREPKELF